MSRPRLFLTGATGTVGSGILEALAATPGYDVDCLVRRPEAAAAIVRFGGRPVFGDMADGALFEQLARERSYDFIVHAAQASYRDHASEEIDRLERQAVRNLEKLRGPATRLMVFTGGVWSYGKGAAGKPITEATPFQPFPAARQRAQLQLELASSDHPWAQLCPPSIVYGTVGPLVDIARALRDGGTIEVLDADVCWSVIERLDLGRAYVALLQHGKARDNFVVAEDEPVRVVDFYAMIAARVGRGMVIRRSFAELAASLDRERLERASTSQPVDASCFKHRTGWRARESYAPSVGRFLPIG